MNNQLSNIVENHLQGGSNHVIKVSSNGVKLVKSASAQKYAFTLEDIESKYGSIAQFLQALPEKGFSGAVVFTLQKTYTKDGKTTYHTLQTLTEKLTQDMNATDPTTAFLGAPELMAKMVQAERSADYKEQVQELKETVKDLRSRNRVLEETNSSLTIKLETAKEREELRVERELLKKKSFLETPAFEKTMETLGGMLPKILEASGGNAVGHPSQLASPNVSPIQKAFVQKLPTATDEQVMFFNYLLDNWQEDLITQVAQIIEQQQEHHEDTN
ncbi:hypothetical protein D6T69_02235 [Tenacibaculum singaporense]|uniref:Uncharacterized protein n=1 Tax=Tenacibaculum singaporense TaxID=2358479 RepID=A0A3S8R3G3_9FLAO|nr:hypothetical protein [Tenacibaculum singaporense]AZJ34409.1 hypothetical protein D6T69_02235 [Tenacibaculum singaporense]